MTIGVTPRSALEGFPLGGVMTARSPGSSTTSRRTLVSVCSFIRSKRDIGGVDFTTLARVGLSLRGAGMSGKMRPRERGDSHGPEVLMSRLFFLPISSVLALGCGGKVIFDTGSTGMGGAPATTGVTTTYVTAGISTTISTTNVGTNVGSTAIASTTGVQVGSVTVGSTTGSGSTTIQCGMATCNGAVDECCASPNGAMCIPKGAPCMGLALDCSSAANCPPSEVCCAKPGGMMTLTATCLPDCGSGPAVVQLCATSAECTGGKKCFNGPDGLKFCFMPGGGTGGTGGGG
jgi:hypothetical protein